MLKWPRAVLLAMGVVLTSSAFAADMRIGFVDTERILREASPAVRAAKKIEREFDVRKADLQKISAQGKALQQLLDKGTLAETDRRIKERELVKMNQDFQRMQREFNEDMNVRRNEELSGLQERVNTAIAQIATSEKYDLILQEVAWRSPRIDITDKVLKLLMDK
ncbi:OmpH family outer membrane protein [Iodobacter fluviatilis]|uniref:Outer membrane protein ompH n=1 Tax=Iodobacter fluviatilis TaxID=537 RepID=A0A377Q8W5_9NEIS|nr:OmpH family outer membrane protein [Iodobacter fluviatilis]TCU88672.1 periplasmic chaperone for outer membrane proteins Skp [Iodobacter fluviatilis]STQ91257.1 Outer membrane protein ompH [Iodobacter fluviatilis]